MADTVAEKVRKQLFGLCLRPFQLVRSEYIDEVSITTKPRFKTSSLSGDEWRTSAVLQFKRKGYVVWSISLASVAQACMAVAWFWDTWREHRDARWVSDSDEYEVCQQPGCMRPPEVIYRVKRKQISPTESECREFRPYEPQHTWFCAEHAERGDCGVEDCDSNYARVEYTDNG